jgi:hypothetical protein
MDQSIRSKLILFLNHLNNYQMKQVILVFAVLFSLQSFAQVSVNGVNINELEHVKYVELVAVGRLLSNKVTISVDYGQARTVFRRQTIRNKDGKSISFNSIIDALNFMENNGWTYVNNYAITAEGNNESHYLLKRKEKTKAENDE